MTNKEFFIPGRLVRLKGWGSEYFDIYPDDIVEVIGCEQEHDGGMVKSLKGNIVSYCHWKYWEEVMPMYEWETVECRT